MINEATSSNYSRWKHALRNKFFYNIVDPVTLFGGVSCMPMIPKEDEEVRRAGQASTLVKQCPFWDRLCPIRWWTSWFKSLHLLWCCPHNIYVLWRAWEIVSEATSSSSKWPHMRTLAACFLHIDPTPKILNWKSWKKWKNSLSLLVETLQN